MNITRKDKLAEETLKAVRPLLSKINPGYAHITPYENGREIGFVIHVCGFPVPKSNDYMDFAWTFSEHRSSDYVVVYSGDFAKALLLSHLYPRSKKEQDNADKLYNESKLFKTPKAAAAFIAKAVKTAVANAVFAARKAS